MTGARAFIDLHCHTSASFDSLASPRDVVRTAAARGLTHLIVTDHDRIDGALEAQAIAPAGLTVIVGEEVKTADGDLICAFLTSAIPPEMSAEETVAAAHAQGGLVGVPHPFDQMRRSLARSRRLEGIAPIVDWVEVHNARVIGGGNHDAALFAAKHGLPGVAVSDAHSTVEVGVAYTAVTGDPSTPDGLLAALATAELVAGRASYAVRLWTPLAKGIQRLRGNRRIRAGARAGDGGRT